MILIVKFKLFFKLYTVKNNDITLLSENLLTSFKQIYVLNTYIFWLALINYYKKTKNYNTNLLLNNKTYLITKHKTNYMKFTCKFSYVLTKHVSKVFTLLRSPMAQKKFSKEQVGFRYYNLNFKITIDSDYFMKNFLNFSKLSNILYLFFWLKEEFYEIFCGLFLFHGFNIYIYTKYFFIPLWKKNKILNTN